MSAASHAIEIELDGRDVRITNPAKVFFPESPAGPLTKLDLVQYYLAVAPGALVGCHDRPNMLHRYPDGVDGEEIYQKRVPSHRPPWIQTTTVRFPSGRSAEFLAIQDAAHQVLESVPPAVRDWGKHQIYEKIREIATARPPTTTDVDAVWSDIRARLARALGEA